MRFQKAAHAYGNTETFAMAESENKHSIILLLFDELLRSMRQVTSIPVIDMETGIMEGVITEADLFQAYLKLQNQIVDLERR